MAGRKTRTCPLCKKEGIKYLSAHLRYKHKMMTAEARAPYLKFTRTTTVKNGRTVLPSTIEDDVLNDFYEKKHFADVEFQAIEDCIVGLYLKASTGSFKTKSRELMLVRNEIQKQLIPLYKMVLQPIEDLVYGSMVQSKKDPTDVRNVATIDCAVGEGKVAE